MDANQLRQQCDAIKAKLLAGETIKQGTVSVWPCPDGNGYLIKARGQTRNFSNADIAIRQFLQEVRLLS